MSEPLARLEGARMLGAPAAAETDQSALLRRLKKAPPLRCQRRLSRPSEDHHTRSPPVASLSRRAGPAGSPQRAALLLLMVRGCSGLLELEALCHGAMPAPARPRLALCRREPMPRARLACHAAGTGPRSTPAPLPTSRQQLRRAAAAPVACARGRLQSRPPLFYACPARPRREQSIHSASSRGPLSCANRVASSSWAPSA